MSQHGGGTQLATDEAIDSRVFRDTMGAFATGVTVVTTSVPEELYGVTVSAFCSLSLEPALVLVCLSDYGHGRELIDRSGAFSINVLAADQAHLSRFFATRDRPRGRRAFSGVPHRDGATGAPVLTGVAAHVDCRVREMLDGGDHVIVIGDVVALESHTDVEPLLFHRGRYHGLGREIAANTSPADVSRRHIRAL